MFGKQKRLKTDADAFRAIVAKLWCGIHLIDGMVEAADEDIDYSYKTTCILIRSLEDTISLIRLYSESPFFHVYNSFVIDKGISMLSAGIVDLELHTRQFDDLKMKVIRMHAELQTIDPDYIDDELKEKLSRIESLMMQMVQTIHQCYTIIRSVLLGIRSVVSKDYMMIMTGVDIVRAYKDNEARMKHELKYEIRFDRVSISKIKKGADSSEHRGS